MVYLLLTLTCTICLLLGYLWLLRKRQKSISMQLTERTQLFDALKNKVPNQILIINQSFDVFEHNFQESPYSESKKVGDYVQCVNSYLENGCGKSDLCPSCPVRQQINQSFYLKSHFDNLKGNLRIKIGHWNSKDAEMLISGAYLDIDNTPMMLLSFYDITYQNRLETNLTFAKEKTQNLQKVNLDFLKNMTHEIRTPLNGIIGFSNVLAEYDLTVEEKSKYVNMINKNSDLLLKIINDCSDLTKFESGSYTLDLSICNLNSLCHNLIKSKEDDIHPDVKLIFVPDNQNAFVYIDQIKFTQVLLNLISNAQKNTVKGEICVGYEINTIQNKLLIYVKDTGIGIPADRFDYIFDYFNKLNNFDQGVGLGLILCKNYVKAMGGNLQLSSEVGVGSCFSFEIPYNIL